MILAALGLTQRKACDSLARLSSVGDTPVGERLKRGEGARWELVR